MSDDFEEGDTFRINGRVFEIVEKRDGLYRLAEYGPRSGEQSATVTSAQLARLERVGSR